MTTTVTAITAQEKQQLVGRFVADVLAKRAINLVKARHAYLVKIAKQKFSKKTVDLVNKIYDTCNDDDEFFSLFGIEINTWVRKNGTPTKRLSYSPDLDLLNCLEASDIPGMPDKLVIELTHEITIDEDDWYDQLAPFMFGENKEWQEFYQAERKLKQDATTLYTIANKSVARKRTWEAIEKNCPELAAYIDVPDNDAPCPADLADLASCMRVKDDC